jgi:hypothetical protein
MSHKLGGLPGSILIAALVILAFASGPPGQAAPGKKPGPEPVWAMQVPESLNLVGMPEGFIYKSGDPYVRVTVQKSTSGSVVTRTTVHFYIYPSSNPPQVWASFRGVYPVVMLAEDPGPGGTCGFPYPFNQEVSPGCFLDFVNSPQPLPGYEHLLLNFWIDADIEDLNRFPIGQEVQWLTGGAFTINFWNSFDPISATDPEPFQTVVARLQGSDNVYPQGFFITRTGPNTWDFRLEQKMFTFSQAYSWAESVIGRNGKPTIKITSWEPLEGEGPLSFVLRLIKNPA